MGTRRDVTSRPAAGGGRWVTVPPERLERWLAGFADRHGATSWRVDSETAEVVEVSAADGTRAECVVPFPPLTVDPRPVDDGAPFAGLIPHALRHRRVGVILVRRGGFAAGVFDGAQLLDSKVGSRHVQGRTAAGGQSQQRFARRREGQARVALGAAADVVARVLLPTAGELDAVVTGGDRAAVHDVLADQRLAPLARLRAGPSLEVGEPRHRVLVDTPRQFRAVHIRVLDP